MHPAPLTLLYSEMPSALALDGPLFCLFSESAAREAIAAHEAMTSGQFAEAVGLPFDRLADTNGEWGGEVAKAFGRIPKTSDSFRLVDYWGTWCFADLVIHPCQAAVLAVFGRPAINRLLEDVGFEFAVGASGADGDAIIFRDPGLIPRLEAEIRHRGLQRQIAVHEGPGLLARVYGDRWQAGGWRWASRRRP